MTEQPNTGVTSDDKLWAALGYPFPILPIVALLMEEKKNRPFIKFHAIQALIFGVVLGVVILLLSLITFGFGAFCAWVLWFATLWPAIDSYKGNYTEIPVITKFMKNQGWA
jgi:uncharacterized membrane protein